MNPAVDRPIFIVAPHRGGTTLLYEILSRHRDVGFLNRYNKRFPSSPRLAARLTRWTGNNRPMEAQTVWDRWKTAPHDCMTAEEVTTRTTDWYHSLVAEVLEQCQAKRFIAKYPRLSLRLAWVNEVFPDALFVHLTRDWRAVVSSTVERRVKRKKRGGGWFGIFPENWRELEDLPDPLVATRLYVEATQRIEQASAEHPERFSTLSYEKLCDQPVATIRLLCQQLDLPWSATFEATLPRTLHCSNWKWPRTLKPEDVEQLRQENVELLSRFERDLPSHSPRAAAR